jgi:hypothetical protein
MEGSGHGLMEVIILPFARTDGKSQDSRCPVLGSNLAAVPTWRLCEFMRWRECPHHSVKVLQEAVPVWLG